MEFFENWSKLENLKAKILLQHSLFGRQMHNCGSVHVINGDRIGLVLKGQEVFMYKHAVVYNEERDGMYTVSDGQLTITIFVNKL